MAVAELRGRAMGSEVHILVDGDPVLLSVAEARIRQLEARWSRFLPTSDVSVLSGAGGRPVRVHPDTIVLLEHLVLAWHRSSGTFDPTVTLAVTTAPAVSPMSGLVIDPDASTAALPPGVTLDPGGLGKGLAADMVVTELVALGARGALVDIGGDLRAAGDGGPWSIAVEDPDHADIVRARFAVWDAGVATSSTRSRRWREAGTERHHVIDPRTGDSAVTDIHTVTVVAPRAWLAEAYATRALVLGVAAGLAEIEAHGLDGIAITSSGDVVTTPRLVAARTREAA